MVKKPLIRENERDILWESSLVKKTATIGKERKCLESLDEAIENAEFFSRNQLR